MNNTMNDPNDINIKYSTIDEVGFFLKSDINLEMIENLKCCGNCFYGLDNCNEYKCVINITDIRSPKEYCDKWKFDNIKNQERLIIDKK